MSALLLPVAAMIAATTPPTEPAACAAARPMQASNTAPSPGVRRLGDMPDGRLMRAVIVRAGPCSLRIVRTPSGFDGGTWRYEVDGPATARAAPANGR